MEGLVGRLAVDMTNQRFGRLLVIERAKPPKGSRTNSAYWTCICNCGNRYKVSRSDLVRHLTVSCGCYRTEMNKFANRKHGLWGTRVYRAWGAMLGRCCKPDHASYKNYGGRGIKVCSRWFRFENFLKDMGQPPKGKSLDRKKNNRGYSKSNCRWATSTEQSRNQRKHRTRAPGKKQSRVPGVINRGRYWEARLMASGVEYYLGRYCSEILATKARIVAEKKYW